MKAAEQLTRPITNRAFTSPRPRLLATRRLLPAVEVRISRACHAWAVLDDGPADAARERTP